MFAKRAAIAALMGLSACGGNPWVEEDGGESDASGGAVYGAAMNGDLTMNSMVYDPDTNELIVNNIPFDGAGAANGQATYAQTGTLPNSGFARYENTEGDIAYFAVFRRSTSGAVQAGAFATSGYIDFGIGGAAAKRATADVNLPDSGEYTFTGQYAAVRVYANSATSPNEVQFVTGDARILLDFGDYDTIGAVVGTVTNRQLYDGAGDLIGPMDDYIALATGEIDRETGTVGVTQAAGISTTTADELTSGNWQAVLGGENGTEIAGIIVLEGASDDDGTEEVRETGVLIVAR